MAYILIYITKFCRTYLPISRFCRYRMPITLNTMHRTVGHNRPIPIPRAHQCSSCALVDNFLTGLSPLQVETNSVNRAYVPAVCLSLAGIGDLAVDLKTKLYQTKLYHPPTTLLEYELNVSQKQLVNGLSRNFHPVLAGTTRPGAIYRIHKNPVCDVPMSGFTTDNSLVQAPLYTSKCPR